MLGQESNAELLISNGAEVNTVDNDLKSILYWSIENGIGASTLLKKLNNY